jgi:hypothetical protein
MKSEILATQCCQCHRIRVNNRWVPKPDFLSRNTHYTHAYCPACLSQVMQEIDAYVSSMAKAAAKEYSLAAAGIGDVLGRLPDSSL